MNIHNPPLPFGKNIQAEQVPGKREEVDLMAINSLLHVPAQFAWGRCGAPCDYVSLNSRIPGDFEPADIRPAGDHDWYVNIQVATAPVMEKIFERAARPGEEHRQLQSPLGRYWNHLHSNSSCNQRDVPPDRPHDTQAPR